MDYCRDNEILLSYLLGCGTHDLYFLFRKCEEWDVDYTDAVDQIKDRGEEINFNNLLWEVFYQHTEHMKDTIRDFLYNIDDDRVLLDLRKLDNYEVNWYLNYIDSGYDDKYEFWECKDAWEAAEVYTDDFVKFLIDEGIVEIDCKDCNEYEVLKKLIQEII